MSLAASQTVDQPIQRTRPPGLPTVRVPNPPVRPFRARGTMCHPAASDAIGARHPHVQALAGAPFGPERASLRVSRPLQGAPRRPLASCLAPALLWRTEGADGNIHTNWLAESGRATIKE